MGSVFIRIFAAQTMAGAELDRHIAIHKSMPPKRIVYQMQNALCRLMSLEILE
jgi:hypothetical protein